MIRSLIFAIAWSVSATMGLSGGCRRHGSRLRGEPVEADGGVLQYASRTGLPGDLGDSAERRLPDCFVVPVQKRDRPIAPAHEPIGAKALHGDLDRRQQVLCCP